MIVQARFESRGRRISLIPMARKMRLDQLQPMIEADVGVSILETV